jgi:hypothetical protein
MFAENRTCDHSTARKVMSTRICETVPLRSRRDMRWPRERTSSQTGRRQVCMRSIHLGFPNRQYDAAASSPEEMTDVWTGPNTPVWETSNLARSDVSHSRSNKDPVDVCVFTLSVWPGATCTKHDKWQRWSRWRARCNSLCVSVGICNSNYLLQVAAFAMCLKSIRKIVCDGGATIVTAPSMKEETQKVKKNASTVHEAFCFRRYLKSCIWSVVHYGSETWILQIMKRGS